MQLRTGSAKHFLRLVGDAEEVLSPKRVDDDLSIEADRIQALNGCNPYSEFLRNHGARPDRGQASTIGRIMGARVRASDGSMQPQLSKGERAALASIKKRRKEWAQQVDHIHRTMIAITALSENQDDPSTVIAYGIDDFSNPTFREQLESALSWLNRFAEESHRHGKSPRATGPQLVSGDYRQFAD